MIQTFQQTGIFRPLRVEDFVGADTERQARDIVSKIRSSVAREKQTSSPAGRSELTQLMVDLRLFREFLLYRMRRLSESNSVVQAQILLADGSSLPALVAIGRWLCCLPPEVFPPINALLCSALGLDAQASKIGLHAYAALVEMVALLNSD